MNDLRYSISNNIISDVFGDEVVLVNLELGIYYSLRGSATPIWIRLLNHYSTSEILADLIQVYQVAEQDLLTDIDQFFNRLLELKIIENSTATEKKTIDFVATENLIDYASPVLETFSDMQEILLLDPVHDVDKSGWPISKNPNTPS